MFRMVIYRSIFVVFVSVFFGCFQTTFAKTVSTPSAQHASSATTPVGYWRQIDDKTGKLQSIIQIWQYQGKLYGRVVKAYRIPGRVFYVRCTKCYGKLHNARIVGMTILGGFKPAGYQQWGGGRILDPTSGKVYKSKIHLKDQGRVLDVRGYIGVPLLGRTQTWYRTKPVG